MYPASQAYNVPEPSALVPNNLLPHVHLVSSYRFPILPTVQPAQALEYLIKGPQIVKDTSPVAWTYFASPPPDGTVIMTWQAPRMQTQFASDGLVWADPEVSYDTQIRGYNIQVLVHKSGYIYPQEQVTAHARFRYRITGGPGQIDPNLWIIHYAQAEPSHRIPSAQIPIQRDVHAQLTGRAQLQAAGPLIRKDFMLEDRANWPEVKFGQPVGPRPTVYPGGVNPMQQRPYQTQPPPAKRQRGLQQVRPQVAAVIDQSLEEEENSTQDTFDFMTPREISLSRYKQHHEWMEEIFSSPYDMKKIQPIDLGLGLMGELSSLTVDILDAPGGDIPPSYSTYQVKNYTKLDPEQLKIFEARVAEYTAKEKAELEKMRIAHTKRIADLKRSRTYIKAERRLRDLPRISNTTDSTRSDGVDGDLTDPLDSVVRELENSLAIRFDSKKHVVCVDKGGFIEQQQPPVPKSPQVNGNAAIPTNTTTSADEGAVDADNSAASLLDQYGSGSLNGTPGANLSVPQISQPPSQLQSAVATPNAPQGDPAQGSSFGEQDNLERSETNDLLDLDVEMSGMTNTEDKVGDGDWVLVGDQAAGSGQQSSSNKQNAASTDAPAGLSNQSAVATAARDSETSTSLFDTGDFGAFDSLDSAGDALADYTNVDDTMGLDLVDDSAFGDAFHGTESFQAADEDGDNA
ncbi:DUF1750-domain-containing protein [Pleomassaria siparia CBS 279.74]|uniref:DUF1750-domain-containing protein n=1 Tax=Pleomassaria siparia CBS 279.74 TaxID=1314801 RepID=A0A6G1KFX9_9PLEO|nr:DUF1750-domain-containing protein [Pleomassaria siparia CBS 279.74]